MSFFQKKDFYSEEIEPNFGTESWFDGKKLQNSYIVGARFAEWFMMVSRKIDILISRNFSLFLL